MMRVLFTQKGSGCREIERKFYFFAHQNILSSEFLAFKHIKKNAKLSNAVDSLSTVHFHKRFLCQNPAERELASHKTHHTCSHLPLLDTIILKPYFKAL